MLIAKDDDVKKTVVVISLFVNMLSNFRFFLEEQQQKNKIPFQNFVTMKKVLL